MTHDIKVLEKKVQEIGAQHKTIFGDDWSVELLKILRHPGWTTPAEFAFFEGAIDHISVLTKSIEQLKGSVLEASKLVDKQAVQK